LTGQNEQLTEWPKPICKNPAAQAQVGDAASEYDPKGQTSQVLDPLDENVFSGQAI
jgi:hypothetical protein